MSISKKTLIHRLEAILVGMVEDSNLSIDQRLEASQLFLDFRKYNPISKRRKRGSKPATATTGILGTR
jgi:hypothetical protein